MTEYLDLDDLLEIARQAIAGHIVVGDYGLLESALARPRASVSARMSTQICTSKPARCCTPWHGTMHWWMETNDLHGQPAGPS